MHDFSEDCVLMVVASELYDEADYIRDYFLLDGRDVTGRRILAAAFAGLAEETSDE